MESLIQLKNVGVNFKQRKSFFRSKKYQALKDITFDVKKGETLGIIGRNGCGKSTLLKVIAGIFEPDVGKIIRHDVNVSLQTLSAGFDEELSGRDNAIISSMLLGHSKKKAIHNMDEINEFSELGNSFSEAVKTYSSGMKARLGFATALTMNGDVLLIDEVLGVGDASFREKAEKALTKKMDSNQTVIFVSHSAEQIKRLCNRSIWIEKGEIKGEGETSIVMEEYKAFCNSLKH